jgi:hypothetical protein
MGGASEEEDGPAKTLLGKLQFPSKPGKDEGQQAGYAAPGSGVASKNERKVRKAAKKETSKSFDGAVATVKNKS